MSKDTHSCAFELGGLGRMQWFSDRRMIGSIAALGGECTGVAYAISAGDHWVVSCPSCQFVLQF